MAQSDFENRLKQTMGLDSVSVGSMTIERAIRLRMATIGIERIDDYWSQLCSSNDELQGLIETVVISETWFFRDPEAFVALVRLVIEEWRPLHPSAVLRLLSIPCSTGEEPYSIVMALLDAGFSPDQFHVDAVDISRLALARAKCGVYGASSFRGQNLDFREHYFRSTADGYVLAEWLYDKVNFRQGNLLSMDSDFAEKPYDVVFCRNLLIYFDRSTQEQAMRTLGSLLVPSGFLFVGPAEAFFASCSGFASVNQAMSFAFRRTPAKRVASANVSFSGPSKSVARHARPQSQPPVEAACFPASLSASPAPPLADLGTVRRLADAGRLRESVESCESHLRQNGPSAEAYYLLGLVRDAIGDRQDAAESYRKTLYLEPDHVEALIHLALLTEREGDSAVATRLRDRARRVGRSADNRTEISGNK
jgi:chemotaxis protein methyltransferase WspC